jgi:hypothetical protein
MFFFEKKNQKTFGPWRTEPGERRRQRPKVFCFFSSEKKTFLLLPSRRFFVMNDARQPCRSGFHLWWSRASNCSAPAGPALPAA